MPDEKLKLSEIAALLVLMREAREVSNTELKESYDGYTLTGDDRKNLNELKLVESWKQGRAFTHVITEEGSARLSKELEARIEKPASLPGVALHAALSALLGGLKAFMDRTDNKLADIFPTLDDSTSAELPAPSATQSSAPPFEPPATSSDTLTIEPTVEARIRAAYAELAGQPGKYVGLAELRLLLPDVQRSTVDNALRAMNRLPDVNIVPESNQKMLSAEDREAAVTLGDQDKHLLWIGA
jgi:hypothetical protein